MSNPLTLRFDGGGRTALHVARPAAAQEIALDARRHERQMHGVEMAVELQGPARRSSAQARRHGRRRGVAADRTLHGKAIGRQQVRQAVGNGTRLPGAAGHGDQLHGRVHEALPVDGAAQRFQEGS